MSLNQFRTLYKLQETELKETRKLLKVSTDAQNDQIKLAALTALLNSNLTRIGLLKSEKIEIYNEIQAKRRPEFSVSDTRSVEDFAQDEAEFESGFLQEDYPRVLRFREINGEVKSLTEKNIELVEQIEAFLKEKTE